jgi:hypothetical protein
MTARRFAGGWTVVAIEAALLAAAIVSVHVLSSRSRWTDRHVLALAGGALMTYAWHSFLQAPVVGGRGALDHIGDAVFALVAAGVLGLAASRQRVIAAGTSPPRG